MSADVPESPGVSPLRASNKLKGKRIPIEALPSKKVFSKPMIWR